MRQTSLEWDCAHNRFTLNRGQERVTWASKSSEWQQFRPISKYFNKPRNWVSWWISYVTKYRQKYVLLNIDLNHNLLERSEQIRDALSRSNLLNWPYQHTMSTIICQMVFRIGPQHPHLHNMSSLVKDMAKKKLIDLSQNLTQLSFAKNRHQSSLMT